MGDPNLMTVQTASLAELFSNGKAYEVPRFQRDYSWSRDELSDLWQDLAALHNRESPRHYMGAIVLQKVSDTAYRLVDGQQRFATLSVLALAIIKRIGDAADAGVDAADNAERLRLLRGTFLGDKDPASLTYSSRLTLNRHDDSFYRDYLVQLRRPVNVARLSDSNRLLWDAFEYFEARIPELLGKDAPSATLARFLNETVARGLTFIQIVVQDELNAYTLFETLNARGVGLGPADLVKNYLYSMSGENDPDLDRMDRAWQAIGGTVGQRRLPKFLRHYFGCFQAQVRKERLYVIVRNRAPSREGAFGLLHDLEIDAELYSALGDTTHDYWRESKEARRWVGLLNLFGATQIYPILFAAHRRFDFDDFARVLKLAVVLTLRYTVVSRLTPSEIEPVYNGAAMSLRRGQLKGPRAVFEAVKDAYVDDERFQNDFGTMTLQTGGRGRSRARYVLYELERDASGVELDMDGDGGTIEHVLPENPSGDWYGDFNADEASRLVYRLGNLTLLEKELNKRIGSAPFSEKIEAYQTSRYAITRAIEVAEWSPAAIAARQRRMAERAVRIWRADFS